MKTIHNSWDNLLGPLYTSTKYNSEQMVEITAKDFANEETWNVEVGNKIRTLRNMPLANTTDYENRQTALMFPAIARIIHDVLNDPVFKGVKIKIFPERYDLVDTAYICFSEPYAVGFFHWGKHHDSHEQKTLSLYSPFIRNSRGCRNEKLFRNQGAPEIFPINYWPVSKLALRDARRLCPPLDIKTIVTNTARKAYSEVDTVRYSVEREQKNLKQKILDHPDLTAGITGVEKIDGKSFIPVSDSLREGMDTYFKYLEDQKHIISGTSLTAVWVEEKFSGDVVFHTAEVQENTQDTGRVFFGSVVSYAEEDLPEGIAEKLAVLQMGGSWDRHKIAGVGFQLNPRVFYIYR